MKQSSNRTTNRRRARISPHEPLTTNLQPTLLRWYRRNGRDLPWRRTRNPYRILVSEVMLQQTQVSRVLLKYREFLKKFPTLKSLAKAKRSDVIRAWQGMGYNNRAVRLYNLACKTVRERNGKVPMRMDGLMELPGVGKYTAHAVACFAFHQSVPVVDTNIARVLNRLYPKTRKRDAWEIAQEVLPKKRAYDWNQALMDLGSMICTASNPKCNVCPLVSFCPSAFKVRRVRLKKKQEPGRDGTPNRIYRGRIVEALRHVNGHGSVSALEVARIIKPGFRSLDEVWFHTLLRGLERDGLVTFRKSGKQILLSLSQS